MKLPLKTFMVGLYYPSYMCDDGYLGTWIGRCTAPSYSVAIEKVQRAAAKANAREYPQDFKCFVVIRGSPKIVYRA